MTIITTIEEQQRVAKAARHFGGYAMLIKLEAERLSRSYAALLKLKTERKKQGTAS